MCFPPEMFNTDKEEWESKKNPAAYARRDSSDDYCSHSISIRGKYGIIYVVIYFFNFHHTTQRERATRGNITRPTPDSRRP